MARKFKSDSEKSKYYGEKVIRAFGRTPIEWALGDAINRPEYGQKNETYSGRVVEDEPGTSSKYIDHYSIADINQNLTAYERRQVYESILIHLGYTSVSREAEAGFSKERKLRKKGQKYKYEVEELAVRSALREEKHTARDLRKGRVKFSSLTPEAQYVIAIHSLLTEMRKCDEILQSETAREEDRARVGGNRQMQRQIEKEVQDAADKAFIERWREEKKWEAQRQWEEEQRGD